MSLDTVVEDIRDEARARAENLREEGERRAEEIIAEAEQDADELLAARERRVDQQIEQEREQALSSANLEAKQQRLEARRDALETVHDRLEEEIVAIDGARRERLTRSLVDAAAPEFADDEAVQVFGRADDEELLTDVLADYDGWTFAGPYDCLGGVVVESETSRVRVNNTFDSVLGQVWDDELKQISERLFEE